MLLEQAFRSTSYAEQSMWTNDGCCWQLVQSQLKYLPKSLRKLLPDTYHMKVRKMAQLLKASSDIKTIDQLILS